MSHERLCMYYLVVLVVYFILLPGCLSLFHFGCCLPPPNSAPPFQFLFDLSPFPLCFQTDDLLLILEPRKINAQFLIFMEFFFLSFFPLEDPGSRKLNKTQHISSTTTKIGVTRSIFIQDQLSDKIFAH